jgi:Domain of unknown function (DUF4129)
LPRFLENAGSFCRGLGWVIVALTVVPASLQAQPAGGTPGGAVSRTRFLEDLEALAAEIAALQSAADAPRLSWKIGTLGHAAEAPAIAATFADRWRVSDGEGYVDISNSWLVAALVAAPSRPDEWPAARTAIVTRLKGISAGIGSADGGDGAQARAQARATVEAILAQSEFQQSAASRWRERLQERVGQWFEDLLKRVGAGRGTARGTALVFAWAAALAALAGLGFWLVRLVAERPRGATLSLASGATERPRARALALRALSAARQGQTREAVRCAYGAALIRLEEQGAWRIDDARTPREYLPMLPSTDSRHAVIFDLTRRFEQIWYGNRSIADDDARRVTDHLEALGCLRPGDRAI